MSILTLIVTLTHDLHSLFDNCDILSYKYDCFLNFDFLKSHIYDFFSP